MKQKAFKEQVFKLLFRAEFNTREELLEQLPFYFEIGDLTVGTEDRARIEERLCAILDRLPEIDAQIAARLRNWRPERIGKVELAVIRMTVYELQENEGAPVGVIINDAVELAKKFGQDGAGQFVNGVLASFVPGQEPESGQKQRAVGKGQAGEPGPEAGAGKGQAVNESGAAAVTGTEQENEAGS